MTSEILIWAAIAVCASQSAIFSGLNLAFFSLSRLRLEVEVAAGNQNAVTVMALRSDPNLVLTTVLIGNVAINVLLTLLTDSVLTGVGAFLFSTVIITAFGEIAPQAYFSRNALAVASALSPVFRTYRLLLYPVARPVALLLDRWLGPEGMVLFREREMRHLIRTHIEASEAEIDRIEGLGALNFLAIDDLPIVREGRPVAPDSVITLPFDNGVPQFPLYQQDRSDPFLQQIQRSGQKWVIFVDESGTPCLVMDADGFLRDATLSAKPVAPGRYCHRPIVITDPATPLGNILSHWNVPPVIPNDSVIDADLVLLWGETKRVITGADVLGRLLLGIAGPAREAPTGDAAASQASKS